MKVKKGKLLDGRLGGDGLATISIRNGGFDVNVKQSVEWKYSFENCFRRKNLDLGVIPVRKV